jgi:Predicted transcriptional regulators containing the CopG/Arc/MetJ DNA-binding domain and a metal-binding domain
MIEKKSTWGGKRPNSGRPAGTTGPYKLQKEKAVKFQISCPPDDYERINALAEREGLSRSQLITEAVRLFDKHKQ